MYVYIIQLEDNRFYVGTTCNPQFSMSRHFNATGTPWTTKYNPIKIIEFIPDCDKYDEDKHVRRYMENYGIDHVRGGSFCDEVLPDAMRRMLEDMKHATETACSKCGQSGHLMRNCVTKMYETELPDKIEELCCVVERTIREKKILQTEDMSDENMVDIWCKIRAIEDKIPLGTREYHAFYALNRKYGFPRTEEAISQIHHFETERVKRERDRNEPFLHMIEALYKVVKLIHQKDKITP
jgi:hypothetical protein